MAIGAFEFSVFYLRVSAACFPIFFKSRSNVSRSFFERTLTAVSMATACSRNPRVISVRPFAVSSTWRTRRSSARSVRETSPFLTSRSTATLMDPGVSQNFGPTVFTGSGPLCRSTRKSESPSSVRLMLSSARGVSALKGFHKDEPDMNAAGVLHLIGSFPSHRKLFIDEHYIDVNILYQAKILT
jgi:hypothetical protein